jgi:hypothetical protein
VAATGAFYGEHCYASQSEAVDAHYSQSAPAQTPGATSYLQEFVNVSGAWVIRQFEITSAGAMSLRYETMAPIPVFPACDSAEKFLDGVTVGWGIASAMICVSALMLMKRGARGG